MDKAQTRQDEERILERAERRLPQPSQTKFSAILNGMGNGAMVGAATYVALPWLYQKLTHHRLPEKALERGTTFATVTGAALGSWYGIYEAKHLEEYRDSIGKEIIHLRDRVRSLEGKHPETHAERVTASREEELAVEPTR